MSKFIQNLESRTLMSVAPAAASASVIAADKAAIKAELGAIKLVGSDLKAEIADARKTFGTVAKPADESALRDAENTYKHDKKAHALADVLTADVALITKDKTQLKTDTAGLFSTIKIDKMTAKGMVTNDESTLKTLKARLKLDSK